MSTLLTATSNLPTWLSTLLDALTDVVNPILIVAATVGIIYSIWVGIKFVKADEKNEREEAKQKLITVIVGIVVTGVLIALFYFLRYALEQPGWLEFDKWFGDGTTNNGGSKPSTPTTPSSISFYVNGIRSLFLR